MKTWLDFYADLILKTTTTCEFGKGKGGKATVKIRKQSQPSGTPMERLKTQFGNALNVSLKQPLGMTPLMQDLTYFQSFLNVFVKPISIPLFAASLDRDAVRSLLEEGETASYNGVLYLDFDHGAYMLSNGIQLRALFVMPTADTKFFAIVGRPGLNSGQRIVWSLGQDDVWVTPSVDIMDEDIRLECMAAMNGRFREIETMAMRAVTRLQADDIPMEHDNEDVEVCARNAGKPGQESKSRFTLFSVKRLTAANARKPETKARSGTSHSKRFHSVRTHMRWQVCGKGRKERRLIEIESFNKGNPANGSVTPLQVIRA